MVSRESYRTFIAVALPRDARRSVLEHIQSLRNKLPDARANWSRDDNLHLTLKFLGDTPIKRITALSNATERVARKTNRFDIEISGCGAFPAHKRPTVLWLGINDQSGDLSELHRTLEYECLKADFPRESKAFHPHLTIARTRKTDGARELGEAHAAVGFAPHLFTVHEVIVFRSELFSDGAKHTVVSRHRLRSPECPG